MSDEKISSTEARLETHEAVCAERYKRIEERFTSGDKRMRRLEYLQWLLILVVFVGPSAALKLIETVFK